MTDKKSAGSVLIHLGGSKTGSTAIQNVLYNRRVDLLELGVRYHDPRIRYQTVQAGNGEGICTLIRRRGTKSEVKAEIVKHLDTDRLAIISHEGFSQLECDELTLLSECLHELQVDYHFLMYVRSPVDFYVSAYNQSVKRHGNSISCAEYLFESDWAHSNFLRNFVNVFPLPAISVLHYDPERESISNQFVDAVRVRYDLDMTRVISSITQRENRSLTAAELNLVRSVNKIFGDRYSTLISDYLIGKVPVSEAEFSVSAESIEIISARHSGDINWLNRTFFGGSDVIKIGSDHVMRRTGLSEEDLDVSRLPSASELLEMILFLLRQSENLAKASASDAFRRLRDAITETPYFTEMANGERFDNVYYLLHNEDIVSSGDAPFDHFSRWGGAEGREWRTSAK